MKNKTKCYCGHTDYCDCSPLEELKQETLEEAAEKYWDRQPYNEDAFKEGAKWQQEQNKKLYNEEEVIKLLKGMRVVCTFGSSEEIEDYINNINKRINGKNTN